MFLYLPSNVDKNDITGKDIEKFNPVTFPSRSDTRLGRLILSPALSMCRYIYDDIDLYFSFQHPILPSSIKSIMLIYDIRFLLQASTYRSYRRLFLKTVIPTSLNIAKHVITISQDTKQDIVDLLKLDDSKVSVVYPGVHEMFEVLDKDDERYLSAKAFLADRGVEQPFMFYVGNTEPRKNLERLVRSLPILYSALSRKVQLVIAGGQYYYNRRSLLQTVQELQLQDQVIFTDIIDDDLLVGLYNLASLHVLPSTHEGFGMTLLESMACGTPIVTSTAGSLPEVAGEAAVLVNPYSIDSIAEGLYYVLSSNERADQLRKVGLTRMKLFTWEKTANNVVRIFKSVLEQ